MSIIYLLLILKLFIAQANKNINTQFLNAESGGVTRLSKYF